MGVENERTQGEAAADPNGAGRADMTGIGEDSNSTSSAEFVIPEAYKDKPYLKDVKGMEDILKKLDGAEKLLGQRPAGVPDENANQEEWDKFYKVLGRPESAEEYEFKYEDGMDKPDPEFEKGLKEVLHKAGLSKKQVNVLQPAFDAFIKDVSSKRQDPAFSDEGFDRLAAQVFGDKKDTVLAEVKSIISDNLPKVEGFDKYLEKLDNNNLIVMASVLKNVKDKYISEDQFKQGGTGGFNTSEGLRAQAKVLLASEAYRNPMHPEHDATDAKVRELYKQIAAVGK